MYTIFLFMINFICSSQNILIKFSENFRKIQTSINTIKFINIYSTFFWYILSVTIINENFMFYFYIQTSYQHFCSRLSLWIFQSQKFLFFYVFMYFLTQQLLFFHFNYSWFIIKKKEIHSTTSGIFLKFKRF